MFSHQAKDTQTVSTRSHCLEINFYCEMMLAKVVRRYNFFVLKNQKNPKQVSFLFNPRQIYRSVDNCGLSIIVAEKVLYKFCLFSLLFVARVPSHLEQRSLRYSNYLLLCFLLKYWSINISKSC